MNRCSSPDHPHCTAWVMPGEPACAHGHGQPASAADALPSSFGTLQAVRAGRDALDAIRPGEQPGPRLHISGFDPRAAGGRQAIKLELRGMPDDCPAELTMLLRSALLPQGGGRQTFTRSLRGGWRPVVVEFSSRGREHGQYRVDVELHAREGQQPGGARTWVATVVLLVPRLDASLAEIHQTYLAARRKVRIQADDASIARLHGLDAAGPLDIAIDARNASIAQVQFGAQVGATEGKIDLALPTIAWDEELIEIDPRAAKARPASHPFPAATACLVHAEPDACVPCYVRLFALDECVLGRLEPAGAEADLLLQHYGEHGPEPQGLTRRLSARHALLRAGRNGFEIEDVSRYGLLLDGVWPGRHCPVPLRLGMRIELTASIAGVAALVVTALLPHAAVLHRVDAGGDAECFILLVPECRPDVGKPRPGTMQTLPRAAGLPLLFHHDGGFWHVDPERGQETPLGATTALGRLLRFAGGLYPEHWVARGHAGAHGDRRRTPPGQLLGA